MRPAPRPAGERLFFQLGDLGAELGQHLGRVLQALGLGVLDPLGLQARSFGFHVGDELGAGN